MRFVNCTIFYCKRIINIARVFKFSFIVDVVCYIICLYNVRKKWTRTLGLTAKWRLTSCNVFLVMVHATLTVALTKCVKCTRNIDKVDFFWAMASVVKTSLMICFLARFF